MTKLENMDTLLNQTSQSDSLTEKYKHITTQDALKGFLESDKGFKISAFQQGNSKSKSKDYAAHIVRLRNEALKIGNDYIELVISNSYDGSIKFGVNLGIFRLVCSNGMIVGDTVFNQTIKHVGQDFYNQVNLALNNALTEVDTLKRVIESMQSKILTESEVKTFIKPVFEKRLSSVKNLQPFTDYDYNYSLKRERQDDQANDLWTIANVIQEKCLKGGISYSHLREVKDDQGKVTELKPSNKVTKAIYQPKATIELNKLIFDQAASLVA